MQLWKLVIDRADLLHVWGGKLQTGGDGAGMIKSHKKCDAEDTANYGKQQVKKADE